MPSRVLAAPFLILALVFLYLAWEVDGWYGTYALFPLLVLAVIYVLSPQIDWWWYSRHPPELKAPLRLLLNRHCGFYQGLSVEEKTRFRQRMALYLEGREFIAKGMPSVPEDVRAVIALHAVWLTFHREDFLLEPFDRIVVYPHPFPSPQFPEHWHASELHEEDGVLLFSAGHAMKAFLQPARYYNLVLHEYARAFLARYARDLPLKEEEAVWERVEGLAGFGKEQIARWRGLPEVELPAVLLVHFLVFPQRFRRHFPEWHARLERLWRGT